MITTEAQKRSGVNETKKGDLLWAEKQWLEAAEHEDRMAIINSKHGDASTNARNAKLYRDVAKSMRLEIEAGEPVCHRCFKPMSSSLYVRANGDATHECEVEA